ncbi:MAG TPA: PA2778 family cysteine peptidase [Burkholderiales bacterium]
MGLETLTNLARKATQNARLLAGVLVCACALALSGCASMWPQTAELRRALPQGIPESAELREVPFFPQEEYQCGPAALATVLAASGIKVRPEDLVPQVYLPERKGSLQVEMLAAARRHGAVSYQLAPRFEDLLRELAAGNPVIVLQNLSVGEGWHYAVAVGYDYDAGRLVLRSGTTERELMPFTVQEVVWKRSNYWAMVALPPDRIAATADEGRWLSAVAAMERTGDAASARVAYASFLKRWPENVSAAVGLANSYYALGALPDAERVLRDAMKRAPDSVVVLNNLAQTLSDQGKNEEALPLIERAVERTGSTGSYAKAVLDTRDTIRRRLSEK